MISYESIPKFWGLLNNSDRIQYCYLKHLFGTVSARNKRVECIAETIGIIKQFCVRNDGDDWRRYLVTGICWLTNGVAINTHQLKKLLSKCKSSINGSLRKIGFVYSMSRQKAAESLKALIPPLKFNSVELRQWTVRLNQPANDCLETKQPDSIEDPLDLKSLDSKENTPIEFFESDPQFDINHLVQEANGSTFF